MEDNKKHENELLVKNPPPEGDEFPFADARTDVGFKHMLMDLASKKALLRA